MTVRKQTSRVEALERARQRGATVLWGPQITDWQTESVIIEGPEGVCIDLYRIGGGTRAVPQTELISQQTPDSVRGNQVFVERRKRMKRLVEAVGASSPL